MRTKIALIAVVLVLSWATTESYLQSAAKSGARTDGTPGDHTDGFSNTLSEAGPSLIDSTFSVVVTRESRFVWPAVGPITSYFGPGHPTGIDIGLEIGGDSPIRASAAGLVSFAGGNPCCEYGYHLVIDHANGMSTLYGHLSQILVSDGEDVAQGDLIALGGATGDADGKHLHFELHQDGRLVDPLRYLPALEESPYVRSTRQVSCPAEPIQVDAASSVSLDFVPNVSLDYRVEGVSISALTPAPGSSAPEVLADRALGVSLRIPAPPVASGQSARFQVETTLRLAQDTALGQDDDQQVVTCRLELRTMPTLPNSASTLAGYRARFAATATASPTATATLWRPSPTRTRTPTPIPTPVGTQKPTATATGSQPVKTSTPPRTGAR